MALMHRSPHHAGAYDTADRAAYTDGSVVDDRRTTHTSEGLNTACRAVAAIAGAVAMVFGAVALIRIDWVDGINSPAVRVADIVFTPRVAIATTALGLIALLAGATRGRTPKLVVGAILAAVGVAILIAGDTRGDWQLQSAHGWLALAVGAVLVLAGLLMRNYWVTHRSVRNDGYAS